LRAEHELRRAELTTEGTLYQMRSKALSLWRTNLWTPLYNQTNLTKLGCESWSHVMLTWSLGLRPQHVHGVLLERASAPV
jgi:hypothetical protein